MIKKEEKAGELTEDDSKQELDLVQKADAKMYEKKKLKKTARQ